MELICQDQNDSETQNEKEWFETLQSKYILNYPLVSIYECLRFFELFNEMKPHQRGLSDFSVKLTLYVLSILGYQNTYTTALIGHIKDNYDYILVMSIWDIFTNYFIKRKETRRFVFYFINDEERNKHWAERDQVKEDYKVLIKYLYHILIYIYSKYPDILEIEFDDITSSIMYSIPVAEV